MAKRFDTLPQRAFLELWRTYDRLKRIEDRLFERHDLTAQQYNALRLLRGEFPGALPTLELAARLVSRAPDITRLVDRLEERGLAKRERAATNRRVVRVALTPKGLALLAELDEPVRECGEEQLGRLSAESLRKLIALLRAARTPHEDPTGHWAVKESRHEAIGVAANPKEPKS